MSSNPETLLPPGFRFHPTDEELILHYLKNRATSLPCPVSIIAEVDIYKFDPWDLPGKAKFGEKEWYFFSPRDRKYPNGVRPNRAAASGYWKATGTDKPIERSSGNEHIGVKKALVFYKGRPPKGIKTNWIMHEYRLAESASSGSSIHRTMKPRDSSMRLDDWVLCRIYRKSSHLPAAASMGNPEQEESNMEDVYFPALPSSSLQQNSFKLPKSSSLSELLDDADYSALTRLLSENPWDMAGPELGSILGHTSLNQAFMTSAGNCSNGVGNYSLPKLTESDSPVSDTRIGLKRQRSMEEEDDLVNPSRKLNNSCNLTSFSNQFDGSQGNLMNQPFFQQQILLKSHLGPQ